MRKSFFIAVLAVVVISALFPVPADAYRCDYITDDCIACVHLWEDEWGGCIQIDWMCMPNGPQGYSIDCWEVY